MLTRRERLRAELIRDIKSTALAHLREHGADRLSLRAVARDLGVSAPGLYRYYSGRDDLLTALIADSYHDLADHLLVAIDADGDVSGNDRHPPDSSRRAGSERTPGEGMAAVCRSYRAWGLAHPHEFGLIYGDPIPGYAAPEAGVTVDAMRRVARALLQPVVEGWRAGALAIPDAFDAPDLGEGAVRLRDDVAAMVSDDVPVALGAFAMSLWAWLHGIVSLEVFGQFHWIYPSGAEPLFEASLRAQLTTAGLYAQA
jgi:AcrR family transcriptional regulator